MRRTCMQEKMVNLRVGLAGAVLGACIIGAAPAPPQHLRCEYQKAPPALDTLTPRFSWWVNDSRRGAKQTAWQVQVFSAPDGAPDDSGPGPAVWDSGKQEGDQCVNVPYAGMTALRPGGRYLWRVRTWDADGAPSPWSSLAQFEIGLLDANDWSADWIAPRGAEKTGDEPRLDGAHWIWRRQDSGKRGARVRLRRVFEAAGAPPYRALVRCTADNAFDLWVNGRPVGRGENWERVFTFDVSKFLRPGRNVVCVRATNEDGPCGFVLAMMVRPASGQPLRIVTDGSWRTAPDASGSEWLATEYDDNGWKPAAMVGKWGDKPWGRPGRGSAPFRSVLFRKSFSLPESPGRARLYVCGLGMYEVRINGRRVGVDRLTPGWTRFERRIQYQTYDVSGLLRAGRNALGLLVGNGWWHGRIGGENKQPGRDVPRIIVQLDAWMHGGERRRITSNDTWKWIPGPVLADSIYDGERFDARLVPSGWDEPSYEDASWNPVVVMDTPAKSLLTPQVKEPLRILEETPARRVWQVRPGVYVADFGRNLAGWVRLRVRGPRGTRIRLRHAEVLHKDDTIDVANLRTARATDEFILAGAEEEVFEPHFTYHGFRYVEITGWPGPKPPPAEALTACIVSTACPQIGRFRCSDDVVNAFQANILRGARSNMYSVPTDCPQRDERLGWTGDAQVFANTMAWNFHVARFFTKWMRDMRDCRRPDGAVQDVAPTHHAGVASPAWGDACIIVPWQVYRHYRDKRIVIENWECMTRWLQFLRRHARKGLYERDGYGDWIAVVPSPKKPISAAYYYYDHVLMARMARAIGRGREAAFFEAEASRIRDAFNAKYLDSKRALYPGGTQTSLALPLFFGLAPEGLELKIVQNLVGDIRRRKMHLSTGFLGTAYLLPVLSAHGRTDAAWALATQTSYPSWGYMVQKGATTVWELWNSDRAGPGMNSRNHFALGSVGEWYYEHLGGITPVEPGFRRIRIAPEMPLGLERASAELESPYGVISCAWMREKDRITVEVRVPANTQAEVHLPGGSAIREGNVLLVGDGSAGAVVPGIQILSVDPEAVVLDVGAGRYRFIVEAPAAHRPRKR